MTRHSKWPTVMRVQGSVMPQMILPLLLVGAWATLITCISHFKHNRESGFLLTEEYLGLIGTDVSWY